MWKCIINNCEDIAEYSIYSWNKLYVKSYFSVGVYQCVVENKEQMRQATAYVDVIKAEEQDLYFPKEYFVGEDPLRVSYEQLKYRKL